MKNEPKVYGPETPNYAILNAQSKAMLSKPIKAPKVRAGKGKSQPNETKPV